MKQEGGNKIINQAPLVSVVVVTFNRKEACELCLNALYSQDYPNLEIIVMDNGSMGNTLNFLKSQGEKIRLILNRINKGACLGRNKGFIYSRGDYVLFLDADAVLVDNKSISYAVEEFLNYPHLGELGGVSYLDKELTAIQHGLLLRGEHFELDRASLSKVPPEINFSVDYVQSDFAMVRREIFKKVGGFDPFYFYYIEDCDLSWQIKKTGFLIGISPKIKFWHQYIPRRRCLDHSDLVKDIYFIVKNYSPSKEFSYLFHFIKKTTSYVWGSHKKEKNILIFIWQLLALPFFAYFFIFSFMIRLRKKINFLYSTKKSWFCEISEKILWFPIKLESRFFYSFSNILFWLKKRKGKRGLYLFVTNRCNLSCPYCFYKRNINRGVNELSVGEIEKVYLSLANKIGGVTITGGEPFLRDDIIDICQAFQRLRPVSNINIITNGYEPELIKSKVSYILANKPANQRITVTVSLDGPEEIHDRARGVSGSFKRAITTVKLLKEFVEDNPRFKLRAQMTLMKLNCDTFAHFYDFVVKNLGVEFSLNWFRKGLVCGINPNFINSFIDTSRGSLYNLPSLEECEDIHQFLLEKDWQNLTLNLMNKYTLEILRKKKFIFSCAAPYLNLVIYPDGDISFCEMIKPLRNIRNFNYDLKKIFSSTQWRDNIYAVRKCFCIHPCILGINMQKRNFIELKLDGLRNFWEPEVEYAAMSKK